MAQRNLLSVGYQIPGWSDQYLDFRSDRSLLDADVVLFQPSLRGYYSSTSFQGKRSLSDDDSARAVEHCKRWNHELKEALTAGKTVFVFLPPLEEVFVHLGQKQYSGTGRNQKVTRIVEPLTNYDALPFDLGKVIPKGGSTIKIATDLKQLAPYWSKFGELSQYNVYLNGPKGTPILTATSPDAIVGLLVRTGKGIAVLLPPVDYDEDEFTSTDKKGQAVWTKDAVAFGNRLVSALLEADRALTSAADITPAPEWASNAQYRLPTELGLESELEKKNAAIERLRRDRTSLETRIAEAGSLRDLLYETGKPLERAILKALAIIGFQAESFKEDGSEFDAVFISPEGRFLGEVEGKNDKAVNVDKLDQLERNIREDFARQKEPGYAKGVLFGNAFRFRPPAERPDFFTEKCYSAASRGKVALVRTTDLFAVAHYLDGRDDADFARACRIAILKAEGVVVTFPETPGGEPAPSD